ncbi:MAG TPA: hypothetical protein VFT14_00340 [Solirubrobacterales bacterium]|nr:hypothetical protein [Solirubrobacterales bacterium]
MDVRLARPPLLAAALALIAILVTPGPARAQHQPTISQTRAIAIAKEDPKAIEAFREHPELRPSATRNESSGDWEVGFFAESEQLVQVVVDDVSGAILESWSGHQVAWKMARGYPGAFGRAVNSPWVWLPLSVIFIAGLFDWRRPLRLAHLDLLVIVGGFGLSHYFFNRGEIGMSVPLAYPPLLYLIGRALWMGFRRDRGGWLRPAAPIAVLAVATLLLVGARIGLNVVDSNVIDVGYSGVIGADRTADGTTLYGNFPEENRSGDTYGPVAYYAYVPFEQVLPWSGAWDDLPAAHAASIFFDLGTIVGLFLLARRLRPGGEGNRLGVLLCFAWAACPYTAYALESNTNDALVSLTLVAALLLLDSPPARGIALALSSLTKFAPLALAPLFATYGATHGGRDNAAADGARVGTRDASARGGAAGAPPRGRIRARRMGGTAATGPLARYAKVVVPFTLAFAATALLVSAQALLDPGLDTYWHRTIGEQGGRDSPFSVWGQEPSLGWLQAAVKGAVIGLALLVAFRPRARDQITVAALGAALVIGMQLTIDHWFYLYVPWFLPLLLIALLGGRQEEALPSGAAPAAARHKSPQAAALRS